VAPQQDGHADARADGYRLTSQALFRSVNDRIRKLNDDGAAPGLEQKWVCECANSDCVESVFLSCEDYDRVRAHEAWFVVLPSEAHLRPGGQRVVERHDTFWVVEGDHGSADGGDPDRSG
jgi:hypothetical protein